MLHHHSKEIVSQNPQFLEGSEDFMCYHPIILSGVRDENAKFSITSSSSDVLAEQMPNATRQEESGREKLFRHWTEAAGRVCIPDKWGQESYLKDWMDCSLFDGLLAPKGVVSAREALVAEGKRNGTAHLIKMERMY